MLPLSVNGLSLVSVEFITDTTCFDVTVYSGRGAPADFAWYVDDGVSNAHSLRGRGITIR